MTSALPRHDFRTPPIIVRITPNTTSAPPAARGEIEPLVQAGLGLRDHHVGDGAYVAGGLTSQRVIDVAPPDLHGRPAAASYILTVTRIAPGSDSGAQGSRWPKTRDVVQRLCINGPIML